MIVVLRVLTSRSPPTNENSPELDYHERGHRASLRSALPFSPPQDRRESRDHGRAIYRVRVEDSVEQEAFGASS